MVFPAKGWDMTFIPFKESHVLVLKQYKRIETVHNYAFILPPSPQSNIIVVVKVVSSL